MRTACKCRAYPDPEQVSVLNRTFGCVRVVWNRTLAWRHARYHGEQARTSFTQANAYLTAAFLLAAARTRALSRSSRAALHQRRRRNVVRIRRPTERAARERDREQRDEEA